MSPESEPSPKVRPTAAWRPLLNGAARRAALDVVEQIAREARPAIERRAAEYDDPGGLNSVSLASGRAGVALFYAYRAECIPGADDADAQALLEAAIEQLGEKTPTPSLYCGFTGVAWVVEHLNSLVESHRDPSAPRDDAEDDDPNADVDELLIGLLDESAEDAEFDLIDGMSGVGTYALERLPRPAAREILGGIVRKLVAMARQQPVGLAWPTPAHRTTARRRLPNDQRPLPAPGTPEYNLGLSHGVPGVIALLARAVSAGIAGQQAAELLCSSVEWQLSQRLPEHESGCYSDFAIEGIEPKPARCAWCYGDPGVAAALLAAADVTGDDAWRSAALAVARKAAAQRTSVRDAGLCHGSAGLGHTFNRLHQATGDESLRRAALDWLDWTMSFRRPGEGLAGFRTWSLERTLEGEWIEDARFLTGIAGIGLALLAATTDVTPAWDRAMMLDLAPRQTGNAE